MSACIFLFMCVTVCVCVCVCESFLPNEEREAQSFNADCFYIVSSQPNQRAAPVACKFIWPRPALNVDSLVRRQELNSLLFLKSQPTVPVRDVIHIPWSLIATWDFYFDISERHILSARAWIPPFMLHLTNPCAKRKVLSLTKLHCKIYKTKSLRNYITTIAISF